MTNDAAANVVLEFHSNTDGSLVQTKTYSTGGTGTGGSLGNQGALALNEDNSLLFVVNPGSGDFSVFTVAASGLTLVGRTPTGSQHPISITARKGFVYVLNESSQSAAQKPDNISGFRVDASGVVTAIADSSRQLSQAATRAAQVALSPNGDRMMVTERGTAVIDSFTVDARGVASTATHNASAGTVPFGFQFRDENYLIVSEEGPEAVSSYLVGANGVLTAVSKSVPSTQGALCWLALTPDNKFAFTGNTTGRSVSGYSLAADATLTLLVPGGLSAATDGAALDVTVSVDGKNLYVVLAGGGLETFAISSKGSLSKVQTLTSLGAGLNGVVAR